MSSARIDTGVWTPRAKRRAWVCAIGAVVLAVMMVPPWILGSPGRFEPDPLLVLLGRSRADPPEQHGIVWKDSGEWKCSRQPDGHALASAARSLHAQGIVCYECVLWGGFRRSDAVQRTFAELTVAEHGVRRIPDAPVMVAVRTVMAAEMRASLGYDVEAEFPGLVATGQGSRTVFAPSTRIGQGCTLAALLVFAVTLPGVVRDDRRHRRALAFLRDGRCGRCGYDVRGLAPEASVCPECGRPMREAEAPAG